MKLLRRFAAPVAGLFLLAFFAGCDSGDSVSDLQTDRTTVEFANPGAGAVPEDGEVSFDVVIRNPDGQAVSAEVLFAQQASTASADAIGNVFGNENVLPVSFAADAEDGDRQTITVDVSGADITGGALEARFALQRLETTGRAQFGNNREFTLSIGPIAIAEALERGVGAVVTIQGTVTRAFGDYARIQDVSGNVGATGMTIRQTFGDLEEQFSDDIEDGTIREGTELLVTGEISSFNGLFQINNTDLSQYTILEQGQPVDPIPVTLQQASSGDFLSVLVRIEGLELVNPPGSFSSGTNYDVRTTDPDNDTELVLRIQGSGESNVGGAGAPQEEFAFEGVMGVFGSPQVLPILRSDIVTDEDLDDPEDDPDDENGDDNGDDEGEAEELSIAEARDRADDTPVIVEAIVTRSEGNEIFFQDETGGLQAFDGGGWTLQDGDEVRFTGEMDTFNEARQLSVEDFEILESGVEVPDPIILTIAEYLDDPESVQGQLVQFEGVTIDDKGDDVFQAGGGDGSYDITDASGETATMRFNGDDSSDLVGEPIPDGSVTVIGPTTRRNDDFRILPIRASDLVEE